MLLIGLDAASNLTKFGYAIGYYELGRVRIKQAGLVEAPGQGNALESIVAPALRETNNALIAIDAPLGWPSALTYELGNHLAGEAFSSGKDAMFHREADRFVHDLIKKKPLEVGADKIARAAHSGLAALQRLRDLSGKAIPLVWGNTHSGLAAIEVYPAGTLKVRKLPYSGYKKPEERQVRNEIVRGLAAEIDGIHKYIDGSADIFDACICLIAGKDYLEGLALPPKNLNLAKREGWIWIRNPAVSGPNNQ